MVMSAALEVVLPCFEDVLLFRLARTSPKDPKALELDVTLCRSGELGEKGAPMLTPMGFEVAGWFSSGLVTNSILFC